MTVKDIMQTSIIRVSEDTPVKEVARIIFSTGISGAPVVKAKKLVGMITEEDILSSISSQKNIAEFLDTPVKKLMNQDIISVDPAATLSEAQDIMLKHNFSRLPILDKDGNMLGIISQGDIFRQIMKDQIPQMEKERYATFISKYYDDMINWNERFEYEFPSLFRIFSREKVKKVLDLGVWTGFFSIGLAQEGVQVLGLDQNPRMIDESNEKKEKLSKEVQKNIEFKVSDFTNLKEVADGKYDAVICMGNSLLYLPGDINNIFKQASEVLRSEGVVILQVLNIQKVIEKKGRLLNFKIQKSKEYENQEHLFIETVDEKSGKIADHNLMVFDSDGENWIYKGTTSVPIKNMNQDDIQKILENAGFTDISFAGYNGDYQGEYGPMSFIKPFDQKTSDWMTVFARKK